MLRSIIILSLSLCLMVREASAEKAEVSAQKPAETATKAVTLHSFIEMALAKGFPDRLPGPIAEQIGISKEASYYGLAISSIQVTDGMFHSFRVIVESSSEAKPAELLLGTTYEWPGNHERHSYRISLGGKLKKAISINGKLDEQGRTIKGSGTTTEKDINSPEIKKRFQHEIDLWLNKTFLKKEWRSAEFSQGALKNRKDLKSDHAGKKDQ